MTLPSHRRTRGPFVTLFRSLDSVETELAHAFGESAHAVLDSVQQEDLLTMAESAELGTKLATFKPEMNIKAIPASKVFAGQFVQGLGDVTRITWHDQIVVIHFGCLSLKYDWNELVLVDMSRSLDCPHIA